MTTFVGVWPVLDAAESVVALVDEAYDAIAALAWEAGCVVVESPRWLTRSTEDGPTSRVPDSPTGLWLVAEAECRPRPGVL